MEFWEFWKDAKEFVRFQKRCKRICTILPKRCEQNWLIPTEDAKNISKKQFLNDLKSRFKIPFHNFKGKHLFFILQTSFQLILSTLEDVSNFFFHSYFKNLNTLFTIYSWVYRHLLEVAFISFLKLSFYVH